MVKIERLSKDQLKVLELYMQLTASKFGGTKKAKYLEISTRLKISVNTIKGWIYRHQVHYEEYISEIIGEKDTERYTLEGLTEKQTIYVKARLEGKGTDEAKKEAGYSEKTKAKDIEKSYQVAKTLEELRAKVIDDTVLGAYAQLMTYGI